MFYEENSGWQRSCPIILMTAEGRVEGGARGAPKPHPDKGVRAYNSGKIFEILLCKILHFGTFLTVYSDC